MKKFASLCCAALLTLCTACSAAGEVQSSSVPIGDTVEKTPVSDINGVSLTDNPLLYENTDPTGVRTFYLTVSKGNDGDGTNHTWSQINTYSVYDYDDMNVDRYKVAAILQEGDENGPVDGEFGYGVTTPNATVQIRGQTSSKYAQKNYKIKIRNEAGAIDGQQTIALNKHWGDPTRMRNKLMYDLMTEIPEMMSLRTHFVRLYVKDTTTGNDNAAFTDYGLYTWVEQLNKTALNAHGADKNGQLYKINYFEFFRYEDVIKLKTEADYDVKKFEEKLEIKGNDDHSKLIAMLDAVNDYSRPIEDVCLQYFDMDNMLTWMAFHILTGNIDTQSRNVYIYSPLNGEKWYFWSWDNDIALNIANIKLNEGFDGYGWECGISNYWGNVLFNRVLKSSEYRDKLDGIIEKLYSGVLSPSHVQTLASEYANVTTPYIYSMPDILHAPRTQAQHDEIVSSMGSEVTLNYDNYKANLDYPMPFFIGVPAVSDNGYACEWDAAYDFEGRDITYTAQISTSFNFDKIVAEYTGSGLQIETPKLEAGQYFIKVTATNSLGNTQPAFDYYDTAESQKVFGVKSFFVQSDGSIKEDVDEWV
ncbi:MAG: spore coat protein CotH [Clostridia bacterium]|nr:spore coat protein CotH [Clostridia bacterium]